MELSFIKEGNKWVAEFEATSDFNLHIEREKVAYINIMQRGSSNGEYDLAKSFSADKIFDYDFGALVYPKYIKVVSGSEVLSASVNFNEGGGSGSGSGEANAIEYLDVSELDKTNFSIKLMIRLSISVKASTGDGNIIAPLAYTTTFNDLDTMIHNTSAICINNSLIVDDGMGAVTVGETVKQLYPNIDAIPRITKEQFYNLEA